MAEIEANATVFLSLLVACNQFFLCQESIQWFRQGFDKLKVISIY